MRIREILKRATWAAGAVATAKLIMGISVPLPDARVLGEFVARSGTPLLRLYNYLDNGALARGSVFALGIMPYLSARIFMAFARRGFAPVRALSPAKARWWTRGVTVGLSLVQSFGYARFTEQLPQAVSRSGLVYTAEVMLVLTTVSTLLMLFVEEATADDVAPPAALLPRERAEHVTSARERDPLYVSHPTPAP